jgi:hypothetical protein
MVFIAALIGAVGLAGGALAAQEKNPDAQKIYAEISGVFTYVAGDRELTVVYWVKEAKLYVAEQGRENESTEIVPVDLAKMKFEATNNDGNYYEIEFSRDEAGKIAKSLMKTRGVEAVGTRIK